MHQSLLPTGYAKCRNIPPIFMGNWSRISWKNWDWLTAICIESRLYFWHRVGFSFSFATALHHSESHNVFFPCQHQDVLQQIRCDMTNAMNQNGARWGFNCEIPSTISKAWILNRGWNWQGSGDPASAFWKRKKWEIKFCKSRKTIYFQKLDFSPIYILTEYFGGLKYATFHDFYLRTCIFSHENFIYIHIYKSKLYGITWWIEIFPSDATLHLSYNKIF